MGRTSDARERLLASAKELIPKLGYHAVGVAELCAHAEVNKGSFYHFFPSKQQLVLDLVDAVWESTRELLEATLGGDDPPLVRLDRYFAGVVEHHRRLRAETGCQVGCPVGNLALEMSTHDEDLRLRLRQVFDRHASAFERLLREASERGDLDGDVEPRAAAEALLALVEGQIMLAKVRDDLAPLAALRDAARRLIGARTLPETRDPKAPATV